MLGHALVIDEQATVVAVRIGHHWRLLARRTGLLSVRESERGGSLTPLCRRRITADRPSAAPKACNCPALAVRPPRSSSSVRRPGLAPLISHPTPTAASQQCALSQGAHSGRQQQPGEEWCVRGACVGHRRQAGRGRCDTESWRPRGRGCLLALGPAHSSRARARAGGTLRAPRGLTTHQTPDVKNCVS